MSAPRKTQKGEQFETMQDLLEWVDRGYWVYFNHKPTHPGWALGWQLGMIKRSIRDGRLFECLDLAGNPYFSHSACHVDNEEKSTETPVQTVDL